MSFLRVHGRSMISVLRPGDVVWVQDSSVVHFLKRRDIVLVQFPAREEFFIKRLIGLPHETVETKGNRVFINGIPLPEPYVNPASVIQPQKDCHWTLSDDRYVVLGDTRDDSLDSRRLGPISRAQIRGRVSWRVWPLTHWGARGLLY